MRFLPAIRRKPELEVERSDQPFISLDDWVAALTQFAYNGSLYTVSASSQEEIAPNFLGLARVAYKTNGIVFACITARQLLLSEARFCFRERRNGRPGNLFTTAALAPLETPWPGATTGDLIARMEMHASLGGNWFGTDRYGGIRSLRPDWMTMIIGSNEDADTAAGDPDAEVIGYVYRPIGAAGRRDPITFLPEEIAHYAPIPDPEAQFRGMSWLTPIIREIMADKAATDHKLGFFENAATPNLFVKIDTPDLNAYEGYVRKFREQHEGAGNSYKTLFGASGFDVTPIGSNFQQMDFKVTQGAGETRIAAAARVPAAIAQISEGLQGS
ncbi:MAG TPA: phage portal protein, partial [Candidatus Acidoferrum sp.]|nr:phage portal protein [Candidatus Acidoferrum sp.]